MYRRPLERTSPIKPTWTFPSAKNQRAFYCESKLEVDALLWLEFDDSVVAYDTQFESFQYECLGRMRRYTPDVRVWHEGVTRPRIVEVKPERHCKKPVLQHKHAVLSHFFSKRNEDFCLMTDKDIYQGAAIDNFRTLFLYLSEPLSPVVVKSFLSEYEGTRCTLEDLRNRLKNNGYSLACLYQLMARGYIEFDFLSKISNNLEVSV